MGMGFLAAFGILIVAASFAFFGVYGFPVLAVLLLALVGYFISAGKGSGAGTIERTKRPEPTGQPRMSHASGDTANERQGQV